MKWSCKICWRKGEFFVDLPEAEAYRQAEIDHRHQVGVDMEGAKVPAGMEEYRNTKIMEKFPSVDCEGDFMIGDTPKKRVRFDKKQNPEFNFGETV